MKTSRLPRGFTLIEMIVSVAIFAIVMVAVSGAYLNLINIDRQTRGTNDVVNNLSFALDSMSRSIRTGTNYCSASTPGCFSSQFSYIDSNNCIITYALAGGSVVESTKPGVGGTCSITSNIALTDPRVTVTNLAFYVSGQTVGDPLQPVVTFTIHGTLATSPTTSVAFTIQTTATERGIDI